MIKVFVETSVLINGSVYAVVKEAGLSHSVQMKARYFEKSNALLSFFRNHSEEKIGITTTTVLGETRNTIRRAAQEEAQKGGDTIFQNLSIILNQCEERLARNIDALDCVQPDRDKTNSAYFQVRRMYAELRNKARTLNPKQIRLEARRMAKSTASPRFQSLAEQIKRDEIHKQHSQLRSLMNRTPSPNDTMFIAEASVLAEKYKLTRVGTMFLASADVQMSPVTGDGKILSCEITDEIWKRFRVKCDWPDTILSSCKSV
jgi:hypothetical protein